VGFVPYDWWGVKSGLLQVRLLRRGERRKLVPCTCAGKDLCGEVEVLAKTVADVVAGE
jgi:hypothetical protein